MGAGVDPVSEYRSVIYYHEDKPKWQETVRIELHPDLFSRSHLRFALKHRSKNEPKEKQTEQPFAVAYLRLVDAHSTILRDGTYDLAVYRVSHKLPFPKAIVGVFCLCWHVRSIWNCHGCFVLELLLGLIFFSWMTVLSSFE